MPSPFLMLQFWIVKPVVQRPESLAIIFLGIPYDIMSVLGYTPPLPHPQTIKAL